MADFMQHKSSVEAVWVNYLNDTDSMPLVQYKCSTEWQHNISAIAA